MATSFVIQSSLVRPVSGVSKRSSTCVNQFSSIKYMPSLQRSTYGPVRCMAEEGKEEQSTTTPTPTPITTPQPMKPKAPKVSTKFSDVLAFSGPAPERINGRLAMIGFVAAMGAEIARGQGVFDQLSNGGVTAFVGTSVVLSIASLIPLFKGVSVESKSKGIMTSDAEMWNGRFAMLGLVALAFTEYVKGANLV